MTPRYATVTPTREKPTVTPKPTFPAESNLALIGHVGGAISAISLQGDFAYIGQGRELGVWEVTDAIGPTRVGYLLVPDPSWSIRDVAVSQGYAYVAVGDAGLWIVDVSDPAAPVGAGFCQTGGEVRAAIASGDWVYVLDSPNDVRVLDISEPSRCEEIFAYISQGQIVDLAVKEDLLFLTVREVGLEVVDLSDPTSLRVNRYYAGRYDGTRQLVDVIVEGDYAYLLGEHFLEIVDISDSNHPVRVGEAEELRGARTMALAGDTLYVCRRGVNIVDVSDRSAPSVWGFVEGELQFPVVSEATGDRLYIVDWRGLHMFDLADPMSPEEVAFSDTLPAGWSTAAVEGYLFVGQGLFGPSWTLWGCISVVDVSDPTGPKVVGALERENVVQDMTLMGRHGFAVDAQCQFGAASCWGGLTVMDVSAPASTTTIGELELDGIEAEHSHSARWGGRGVAVEGDRAVVIGGSYYKDIFPGSAYGLLTIDVSDPGAPRRVGALFLAQDATEEDWWSGYDVAVADGYAYVAAGEKGLRVVDVSDAATPVEIGALQEREAYQLAVASGWAYIADAEGWLWVADISVPSAPQETRALPLPGKTQDVLVWGRHAYVAVEDAGLLVFDLSDPGRPRRAGFFAVARPQAVAVVGDVVYLVDSETGLYVLRFVP
jgi:hypothetical protein